MPLLPFSLTLLSIPLISHPPVLSASFNSPSRYLSVSHKQTSYLCEDVLSDLHEHRGQRSFVLFFDDDGNWLSCWRTDGTEHQKQRDDKRMTKHSRCFSFHVSIKFLLLPGWYEGERLRDGERGWFLAECAEPITCQATIERNMQRMDRLQGLETNVWTGRGQTAFLSC